MVSRLHTGEFSALAEKIHGPDAITKIYASAVFGSVDSIIRKISEAFDHRHADVLELKTELPKRIFCVLSPDLIAKFFTDQSISIAKPPGMMPREEWLMREALIADTGRTWKRKRAVMAPPFMPQNHGRLFDSVEPSAARLAERLDWHAAGNGPVNMCREMRRCVTDLSLRMFCSTVLEDELLDRIVGAIAYIEHNMPVQAPIFLPLPGNLAFKKCCRELREFCSGLVRERRNAPDKPDDVLTCLLSAEDAALQRTWTDDEVLDQLLAVLLGASAIATPLFWTAYLLSVQPATCRRVLAEYRAACGERKVASYEQAKSLTYFEWVMQESMRLYPPFWGNIRYAEQPFQVDGYTFPKNSVFLLLRYFANRHSGYWHNPQAFNPERFDPADRSRIKPRYFIPFGAGPRTCLGVHMSVPICKMILGHIFTAYEFAYPTTLPNGQPKVRFMYGLYPRNDILLDISRRA